MENKYDTIVESVITKYKDRANIGFTKYGTNLVILCIFLLAL